MGWFRPRSPDPRSLMAAITREMLLAYLDDTLSDAETAQIEQALRESEELRQRLQEAMGCADRGEHSLGAIWRRERLTCPTRDQLGSYLMEGVLDEVQQDYIDFHLKTIGCAYCLANLADLQAAHQEPAPQAKERRRRLIKASATYLQVAQDKPQP
jgi:hypothetical protein